MLISWNKDMSSWECVIIVYQFENVNFAIVIMILLILPEIYEY